MGFIYLIGKIDNDNICKIGVTNNTDVNKRKGELQTGSSDELYIRKTFETKYPYKLEKMLHKHFHENNILNEWFELTKEDIDNFEETCKKYNNNFIALENNPFFKKQK